MMNIEWIYTYIIRIFCEQVENKLIHIYIYQHHQIQKWNIHIYMYIINFWLSWIHIDIDIVLNGSGSSALQFVDMTMNLPLVWLAFDINTFVYKCTNDINMFVIFLINRINSPYSMSNSHNKNYQFCCTPLDLTPTQCAGEHKHFVHLWQRCILIFAQFILFK